MVNDVSVFNFDNYRVFLNSWLDNPGTKSRGGRAKLAEAARVSAGLISQILSGQKDLSQEQALEIAEHIGLKELETDYFLGLVQLGRAGTHKLQTRLQKKISAIKDKSKEIESRVRKDRKLSLEEQAQYYSSWIYTAITNLVAIPNLNNTRALAQHLKLPHAEVIKALEFLLKVGVVVEEQGFLKNGMAFSHLGNASPFTNRQHNNWRIQGLRAMDERRTEDLFYTGPMSLSLSAAEEIRKLLIKLIADSDEIVGPSESQVGYCLNVDYFKF